MMTESHPVENEQVMAFLDGELDPKLAARVAAHIEGCVDCRTLRDDLLGVSSRMGAWNLEPSPEKLTQAVSAQAQAHPSRLASNRSKVGWRIPLWRRVVFNRITWAALCLLVCVGIVLKVFAPASLRGWSALIRVQEQGEVERGEKLAEERGLPLPGPPPGASHREPAGGGGGGSAAKLAPSDHSILYAPSPGLNEMGDDISVGPMIARTTSLKISVKDVDSARVAMDRILQQFRGYAANLTINSDVGSPRSIESEIHIPVAQIDPALAAFKSLGRVEQEEQGGEEVTAQVIDLDARLKNARESESRLQEILRTRTGKVSDVLEVEQVISETRENIERMEAEQKELRGRVAYSSIKLELHEEYQAKLGEGTSVGRQIRNAIVDGFQAAGSGGLAVFIWLLDIAPSLLLSVLILFLPMRWAWRKYSKNWRDWMERERTAQL
jgi:hypothetical protein